MREMWLSASETMMVNVPMPTRLQCHKMRRGGEREHRMLGWIDNSVRAEVFIFERVNELLKSLSRFRTLEWKTIVRGKFSSSQSRALNEKWKWLNFFVPHRCRPQSSGFYNLRHHHAYLDPILSGEDVWMSSTQYVYVCHECAAK